MGVETWFLPGSSHSPSHPSSLFGVLRWSHHTFWGWEEETRTNAWDGLGQRLVSGVLDDTKTIGKAGADIFANFGAEQVKPEQTKISLEISHFF